MKGTQQAPGSGRLPERPDSEHVRPLWSRRLEYALTQMHAARKERDRAIAGRCLATRNGQDGDIRCTADADIPHDHRYDVNDLPRHMI